MQSCGKARHSHRKGVLLNPHRPFLQPSGKARLDPTAGSDQLAENMSFLGGQFKYGHNI